jgi:2'-5' RNA ligase
MDDGLVGRLAHDESMADHWWWRPGWRPGRRFYTWHLTFDRQEALHGAAEVYRRALGSLPALDLVPDQWLHLTMQGVGFVDEVSDADIEEITRAVQARVAPLPAFTVGAGPVLVTDEAIQFQPTPQEPLARLREAVREGIAAVWDSCPEPQDGFVGHITVAYGNSRRASLPYISAVNDAAEILHGRIETHIAAVDLIQLNRDQHMYQWDTVARIPLAS